MKLFGTDGIRGIAGTDLTPELALKLGRILAERIHEAGIENPFVLTGRDTRHSGTMLSMGIATGLMAGGVDCVNLSVIPTPGVAYLVRHYGAALGIVISASHNPYEYNGIKIFSAEGFKLPDSVEEEIEEKLLDPNWEPKPVTGMTIGTKRKDFRGIDDYEDYLVSLIDTNLDDLTIAIDCGNGALSNVAENVLTRLGAKVAAINTAPDGKNINDRCGSTDPSKIIDLVKETVADIGFSFDGDADRIIAVDEKGRVMDGDHILAVCAAGLKEKGELTGDTVVGTIMSNIGLDRYLESIGASLVKTKVGDRYVLETMREKNYVLGGEQSGHIIFIKNNTTGDGLATGLHLLEVMEHTGKPMSELNDLMTSYPQVLVNATVANEKKRSYETHEGIQARIAEAEAKFEGEGRVVIRPSGTEPVVRVMIEGKDQAVLEREAESLARYIEEELR
ncbi:phosphoglucosamine mutase [Aedoeadaptatus nemausensis]|uniref:Phosphoglucosamine mutase n=1 Tax=Aedoeadaptatus nemausensis TaxID=2582829 RepID=A0A6V6Y6J3_9FIRM|nr:phosphoglucosamine mutase [Peptoniphilus nemausensis]CAC9934938.1 phosphoglucosamine mutase [Peptoniphilus nemausensis]